MSTGPLDGVTVVDLTRVLAGPYCTMMLSDLGARVIKVEHPERGDDARHIGPFVNGVSAYFASLNRGKESVALDLDERDDRLTFRTLLDEADVLVENFRPGVMDRLGYGWEAVHDDHPRLVYASVSGFGQTGPYATRPAYDMVVQGMGGIMSITGPAGCDPTRVGTSVGDITAGLFTAVGVSTALYHRERSGEGTRIDVGMLDCQVAILENAVARCQATGESPGPIGNRHPSITPFGAYRAADGWLVIAAGNDELFGRLCDALGAPALADDPRFATNEGRTEHVAALDEHLSAIVAGGSVGRWLATLEAVGVPCGPVNDVGAVLADPQVAAARNMVVDVHDPRLGRFRVAGNPIKMSGFADPAERGPVPPLGRPDST
jgi:CoA:oxalate CoA-transferase